jgi:glycosyltransferase EpsD
MIKAVKMASNQIPQIKLLLVGSGSYAEQYKELAKELNLAENVQFLGYRDDIVNLLLISNLAVSSSRREGLTG